MPDNRILQAELLRMLSSPVGPAPFNSANAAAAATASARQGAIQMFSPINLVLDEASFGTKHERKQNGKVQTKSSEGELDDRCGQVHYRCIGDALGTASNRLAVT